MVYLKDFDKQLAYLFANFDELSKRIRFLMDFDGILTSNCIDSAVKRPQFLSLRITDPAWRIPIVDQFLSVAGEIKLVCFLHLTHRITLGKMKLV